MTASIQTQASISEEFCDSSFASAMHAINISDSLSTSYYLPCLIKLAKMPHEMVQCMGQMGSTGISLQGLGGGPTGFAQVKMITIVSLNLNPICMTASDVMSLLLC